MKCVIYFCDTLASSAQPVSCQSDRSAFSWQTDVGGANFTCKEAINRHKKVETFKSKGGAKSDTFFLCSSIFELLDKIRSKRLNID